MGAEDGSRRRLRAGMLAATLAVGLLTAGGLAMARDGQSGRRPAAAASTQVPTGTATVVRSDIVERQQVAGTLGYDGRFAVVVQGPGSDPAGQPQSGTVTRLPVPGAVLARGQTLYEIDGNPVPLWYGTRPAWRTFALGMPDGADVRQVEANLVALGFDPGRAITVDRHFSWATAAAVRRWQHAAGLPRTGTIPLGRVVFLPGRARVGEVATAVGAVVQTGAEILAATSTRPVVTADLNPAVQQSVRRGDRVLVTLPDGAAINGRVRSVGRVADVPAAGTGPDQGGDGDGAGVATIPVTVELADPRSAVNLDQAPVQVAIATATRRGVLAVPITALLAEPGGGYAVALAEGGGRRLVEVETGLFDETAGLVEVDGRGLAEGAMVEVPAP
jgi:peptidoglycan hydrolase-like protein with peptidoglycan-binding domain